MLTRYHISGIIVSLFICINGSFAGEKSTYVCGLADGYPPYQFKDEKSGATGFDSDVIRMVFETINKDVVFHQTSWDDVVGNLYFTTKLDCVGGMEINNNRKERFDFTTPYYSRKIAVFIRSDNNAVNTIEDLIGKRITGDRDSSIEAILHKKWIIDKIRIQQTASKKESMRLLKIGDSAAMIAPKEVALFLAKQFNVRIKILVESEIESPVGIAVKKGNMELLKLIDSALLKLVAQGKIKDLYDEWFN